MIDIVGRQQIPFVSMKQRIRLVEQRVGLTDSFHLQHLEDPFEILNRVTLPHQQTEKPELSRHMHIKKT